MEGDDGSEEVCKLEDGDLVGDEGNIDGALGDDPVLSELAKDLAQQLGLEDGEGKMKNIER